MDSSYTYYYYLLGSHPVKLTNEDGVTIFYQRYDFETKKLVFDPTLNERVLNDFEGYEMTEKEFQEYIEKNK